MAWYSLFAVKVSLNTNQSTNLLRNKLNSQLHRRDIFRDIRRRLTKMCRSLKLSEFGLIKSFCEGFQILAHI